MNTYVAVLRGINVSGQKIINMKELKTFLTKAGLHGVMTYIQSGNIVFQSEKKGKKELQEFFEEFIKNHYGFEVHITILT